jgi:hypothetical protein
MSPWSEFGRRHRLVADGAVLRRTLDQSLLFRVAVAKRKTLERVALARLALSGRRHTVRPSLELGHHRWTLCIVTQAHVKAGLG